MSNHATWGRYSCLPCHLMSLAVVQIIMAAPLTIRAAGPELIALETRTYDIFVDHKKSGQSTFKLARYGDGTEIVSTDAKLTVSWTVFTYVYEFHGEERWHRGRLDALSTRAVDGGKHLSLAATRTERGLTIRKQSGSPAAIPEVQATTNYWSQPAADPAGSALKILDADNGKVYDAQFQRVGYEDLLVADQRLSCSRCRISGGAEVELWFDSQGLLVRQIGKEDGHHTELRLVSIQQPMAARATRLPWMAASR